MSSPTAWLANVGSGLLLNACYPGIVQELPADTWKNMPPVTSTRKQVRNRDCGSAREPARWLLSGWETKRDSPRPSRSLAENRAATLSPPWHTEAVFEGFTDQARRVLTLAQEEARELHHPFIGTEHLLLGLLREHDGIAAQVLGEMSVPLEAVRYEVAERVGHWASAPNGSPPYTPRAKKVLDLSGHEAKQLGHSYIGTEHLMLGIVGEGEGIASEILTDLGVELVELCQKVVELLPDARPGGYAMYSPLATAVRGGVYRLTSFRRLWYRYPGRWVFPLVAWLDCSVPGTRGRVGWISRPIPRSRQFVTRSAVMRRPGPQAIRPERPELRVPVGTKWTATIVCVGRGPEDFAKSFEELWRLAAKVGVDVDDSRVRVESVQTDEGPGLRLALSYRLDEPGGDDGEDAGELSE